MPPSKRKTANDTPTTPQKSAKVDADPIEEYNVPVDAYELEQQQDTSMTAVQEAPEEGAIEVEGGFNFQEPLLLYDVQNYNNVYWRNTKVMQALSTGLIVKASRRQDGVGYWENCQFANLKQKFKQFENLGLNATILTDPMVATIYEGPPCGNWHVKPAKPLYGPGLKKELTKIKIRLSNLCYDDQDRDIEEHAKRMIQHIPEMRPKINKRTKEVVLDKSTGQPVMEQVTEPVLDENGNVIYNDEGEVITKLVFTTQERSDLKEWEREFYTAKSTNEMINFFEEKVMPQLKNKMWEAPDYGKKKKEKARDDLKKENEDYNAQQLKGIQNLKEGEKKLERPTESEKERFFSYIRSPFKLSKKNTNTGEVVLDLERYLFRKAKKPTSKNPGDEDLITALLNGTKKMSKDFMLEFSKKYAEEADEKGNFKPFQIEDPLPIYRIATEEEVLAGKDTYIQMTHVEMEENIKIHSVFSVLGSLDITAKEGNQDTIRVKLHPHALIWFGNKENFHIKVYDPEFGSNNYAADFHDAEEIEALNKATPEQKEQITAILFPAKARASYKPPTKTIAESRQAPPPEDQIMTEDEIKALEEEKKKKEAPQQ